MEHEKMDKHESMACSGMWCKSKNACGGNGVGSIYGLGIAGAIVYYIQHADTFWMGAVGVLKAIIWPAMLVYNMLGFLQM